MAKENIPNKKKTSVSCKELIRSLWAWFSSSSIIVKIITVLAIIGIYHHIIAPFAAYIVLGILQILAYVFMFIIAWAMLFGNGYAPPRTGTEYNDAEERFREEHRRRDMEAAEQEKEHRRYLREHSLL